MSEPTTPLAEKPYPPRWYRWTVLVLISLAMFGNYYVYDLKDETNFLIGPHSDLLGPFWMPNSAKVIYLKNQTITAVDYDNLNQVTLFAGNFNTAVVFPWADGTKIITLTSAYVGAAQNLYAVTVR